MIHYERGLDHMLLGKLLKEEIEYIALLVSVLELNALFLGDGLSLVVGLDLVKVNARVLLYRVKHSDALKGLAEVHLNAAVGDLGRA